MCVTWRGLGGITSTSHVPNFQDIGNGIRVSFSAIKRFMLRSVMSVTQGIYCEHQKISDLHKFIIHIFSKDVFCALDQNMILSFFRILPKIWKLLIYGILSHLRFFRHRNNSQIMCIIVSRRFNMINFI